MPGREDVRYRRSGDQLAMRDSAQTLCESQLKIKMRLV